MSSVPVTDQPVVLILSVELLTKIGEHSVDERAPKPEEFARTPRRHIFFESSRALVVPEPCRIVGTSSYSQKEGQEDYANLVQKLASPLEMKYTVATYDSDDFDATQPKLDFTEESYAKVVDKDDDDKKDGNPDSRIDFLLAFPFLDNESRRSELIGRSDNVLEPVRPAEGHRNEWHSRQNRDRQESKRTSRRERT
jgi:hypothetical protein